MLRRAAPQKHGHHLAFDAGPAHGGDDLRFRRSPFFEERFGDPVVDIGQGLDQRLACRLRRIFQIGRNRLDLALVAEVLAEIGRLHADQIDDTTEICFGTDRQLQRHGGRAESFANLPHDGCEVGPGPVHLVDERDTRHVELVGLSPDRFGLRLDAADAAEDDDGTVENAQAAFDLDREIDMARRVDQMDLVVFPVQRRGRRRDRDAALALLRHPVHLCFAVVDFADAMDLPAE